MVSPYFSEHLLPIFSLDNISVIFKKNGKEHLALDNISLKGYSGKTLAIVGESGSGKTTLAKVLMALLKPSQGTVNFRGQNLFDLSSRELRQQRRSIQMIFQDPDAALNPRMRMIFVLKEAILAHKPFANWKEKIEKLMHQVNLPLELLDRYPHELSGGQKQRMCIARSLAMEPQLLICDEPLSALDMSLRQQMIHLLKELQSYYRLSLVFISHDLSTIPMIAHEVAVLKKGKLVEFGPTEKVYTQPGHPYTLSLLQAVPIPDPKIEKGRKHLVADIPT